MGKMHFDAKKVTEYYEAWGSPLYVFDEESFLKNYLHFETCFKSAYKKYLISYSYKTNYSPYICRLVRSLGGYAEVVSDMELMIARMAGNPDDHIVYNGPSKGPLLDEFLLHGGIVNVDNYEELNRILTFAGKYPEQRIKFGLRVNIDIGQGFVSRFGIDEDELGKAFERVRLVHNAKVIGLHCHIGKSRSIEAWRKRAQTMLGLADRFFTSAPSYISLGSGMYGEMMPSLAHQFGEDLPSYEAYAEVVARPFADHYPDGDGPILFTEPGTTLINKYISFIAKVTAIKHIKGKTFVVLDGSKHNLGELCELKQLPVQIMGSGHQRETVRHADFVGYTCLEHDILRKDYDGEIAVGDYVIFDNVGGYSNVSKPPFIKPNCCMVSSKGNLIKRAESTEEIICTYE